MGQQGAFGGGEPAPGPVSPASPASPVDPASLPVTECARGWKCVSALFCDAKGVMVAGRVELSPAEEAARGPLSPCMDPATGQFQVCCRAPPALLSPPLPAQPAPAA